MLLTSLLFEGCLILAAGEYLLIGGTCHFGTLGIPCQHSRHRIEKSTPVGSGRLPFFQEGFDRTSAMELQHHNSIWKGVCLKHLIFFGVGTHPNHRNTKLSCFPCSDFFCSLNQQEHVGQMRLTCLFQMRFLSLYLSRDGC